MVLYQPTEPEICAVLAPAYARWPFLRTRLDKAGCLLRDPLRLDPDPACFVPGEPPVCFLIHSQSRLQDYPVTVVDGAYHCTCHDYRHDAPDVQGQPMCKHALAAAVYLRVLRNQLNDLLDTGRLEPLPMGRNRHLLLLRHYPAIGLIHDSHRYCFARERSAVRFAHFLYFYTRPERPLSQSYFETPNQDEWQPHPAAVRWMRAHTSPSPVGTC